MFIMEQVISDPEGCFVIVSGVLFHKPVILVNVFAPNLDNPTFMSKLFLKIPNLDTHQLIFWGGTLIVSLITILINLCPNLLRLPLCPGPWFH